MILENGSAAAVDSVVEIIRLNFCMIFHKKAVQGRIHDKPNNNTMAKKLLRCGLTLSGNINTRDGSSLAGLIRLCAKTRTTITCKLT
jgi:hypothetical protein